MTNINFQDVEWGGRKQIENSVSGVGGGGGGVGWDGRELANREYCGQHYIISGMKR